MTLSWNEIKSRALAFSKEWENTEREEAEAKPFLIEFLNVFGITRKRVATFEHKIKKLNESDGYIDMLWKGFVLIEMKSKGKDLDKAYQQAKEYCHGLKEYELPELIIVSDFDRFQVYNEAGEIFAFKLSDLSKNVRVFGPIAGYAKRTFKEQDPVNIKAAELMGKLHDNMKALGYEGHSLEKYLVRLLFCLFADDTGIFDKDIFHEYIELRTNDDGSDLAAHLAQLFQILNTEETKRLKALDELLTAFPFVNGKLFEENLPVASFDSKMRASLLECCNLDWSKISPAIFGSMFQSVMDKKARRNLGAHYTSEKNILKLIKPLFLDELWKEFEFSKSDKNKLKKLHEKISKLRFLDPACGCGNFLIIAYRELRLLELEIVKLLLKNLYQSTQRLTSINDYFLIDVDQFYGIEYEEFPAQIAQVAMWLIDHQMNVLASDTFGEYYIRLPLRKSATIRNGNALAIEWQSLIDPMPWEKNQPRYHYLLGNPPFSGKHLQNVSQKADMDAVFENVKGSGLLDYVTAWYIRAAQYMQNANVEEEKNFPRTRAAFVSTNSIAQGEQVGIIWNELFNKYHCKIHFAHRTFKWGNEARGNAAVHVVIIGFGNFDSGEKLIYEYDDIKGEPHELKAKNINPYLVEGKDILIPSRSKAICVSPEIVWGNKPVDGGNLLFTDDEKNEFIKKEPGAKKYIKALLSAKEFLNGENRWCLWLVNADPTAIREMPLVMERIKKVKEMREASVDEGARKLALKPSQFRDIKNPESFILIPSATSENRKYIPFGFFDKNYIANNSCHMIPDGNLYHFGILTSEMHMSWVKHVCGRLKSDFRYSKDIVYNNYPWPENLNDKQKSAIDKTAQGVLEARAKFPNSSLADLYDPNTMPSELIKAHQALDKAVDLCYRPQPFPNETKRLEFLFDLYDKYTAGLFVKDKKSKLK
jgi:hypothetical protein